MNSVKKNVPSVKANRENSRSESARNSETKAMATNFSRYGGTEIWVEGHLLKNPARPNTPKAIG